MAVKVRIGIIFVFFLLAIVFFVYYLSFSNNQKKTKADTAPEVSLLLVQGSDPKIVIIKAKASSTVNIANFILKVIFSAESTITNIQYNFGTVSSGLGDSNDNIAAINGRTGSSRKIMLVGESGATLLPLQNTWQSVATLTFNQNQSGNMIRIENDSANTFTAKQSDGTNIPLTIVGYPYVLSGSTSSSSSNSSSNSSVSSLNSSSSSQSSASSSSRASSQSSLSSSSTSSSSSQAGCEVACTCPGQNCDKCTGGIICNDGTTGTTRQACDSHGGIRSCTTFEGNGLCWSTQCAGSSSSQLSSSSSRASSSSRSSAGNGGSSSSSRGGSGNSSSSSVVGNTGSVTLNMKLRLFGMSGKPKDGTTSIPIAVRLSGGSLTQNTEPQTGTFTVDDSGIWSGQVSFSNISAGSGYKVLVKGPKHLQKKICHSSPTEASPGTYKCSYGAITLQTGTNAIDASRIMMLGGDIPEAGGAQNGVVDAVDLAFLKQNLGSADSAKRAIGDLNYDGIIDSQDYSIVMQALSVKVDEE